MLALVTIWLQAIDVGLFVLGAAIGVGWLLRVSRHGRWRHLLRDAHINDDGPTIAGAVVVVAAFVILQSLAAWLAFPGGTPTELSEPGSAAWHRAQLAAMAADVVLCVLMVVMLVRTRALPWRLRRCGIWSGMGIGLLGMLALIPVLTVQHQFGQEVWRWLNPDVPPPTHVVLEATRDSAWGPWGAVQLFVGAAVFAPLREELFFRGIVLQACWQHTGRVWTSVLLSGLFFGMVHMAQPQDVLPLVTMGLVLGYICFRCGSLWPCIVLHMLWNARTMTGALLAPELLEGVR